MFTASGSNRPNRPYEPQRAHVRIALVAAPPHRLVDRILTFASSPASAVYWSRISVNCGVSRLARRKTLKSLDQELRQHSVDADCAQHECARCKGSSDYRPVSLPANRREHHLVQCRRSEKHPVVGVVLRKIADVTAVACAIETSVRRRANAAPRQASGGETRILWARRQQRSEPFRHRGSWRGAPRRWQPNFAVASSCERSTA